MFKNINIGPRLTIGFATVLALLVGTTVLAWVGLNAALRATEDIVAVQQRLNLTQEWAAQTTLNVNRVMAQAMSRNDPRVVQHFQPLMAQSSKDVAELQKGLEERITSEQGKALLAAINEKRNAYLEVRKRFFDALQMEDYAGAQDILDKELPPAVEAYSAEQQKMISGQRTLMEQAATNSRAAVTRQITLLVALAVCAIALAAFVAWAITRSVTEPLKEALSATDAVAEGDLTREVRVDRQDELGRLLGGLSRMRESLVKTVGQVRTATDSINTASAEIASGNQDLSSRTEQTASNLQETAASMEQLTSTVRQSADAARQANQLASTAAEIAQRGGSVVSEVVNTMDEINQASRKINDIIGVIDGIAFQTNILALNAAVEAARAGEQGRGFAVVAGEVRNLAQRSAEAAKEIKALIGASVDKVEAGSQLVANAGETMHQIMGSVQRVTDIIGEISAAAGEQSDGIGQVNTAVSHLDQMTQQNAALVEQSTAAAQSLRDQATRLAEVVQVFRLRSPAA
ncbi:methyl-accepting chemotaxis protein [Hydrogenophaga sp. SNF1]|nr:methyl-accepting chemotaxis protein [Hydrogenophaga sp. SNF1]WQB82981.1 methyl-accepting chemotaxis protein [Hydrogenophaga sp. SNF1]